MALNTFVYIRNVDNLSDARYCAGMGVEMIGFKLDQSQPGSLSQPTFKEISDWISGVKIVGEFGDLSIDQIQAFITSSTADYLLVPEIGQLEKYASLSKPLILQMELNSSFDEQLAALNFNSVSVDYLLITSNKDAIDDQDRVKILELSNEYPVLLGFGINDQNAKGLTEQLGLIGISLAGSSEIRPGFKDYDELADILEALEVD
jgi:phosphoribosylanthranilate isomerase